MGNRAFIAVLAALGVIALLGFGLIAKKGETIALGEPVPDAPVELLGGGGERTIADHRGEWVLVNFWASWCDPCRTESPAIEAYKQRHASDNFTVIGMNTEDLTSHAEAFVDEFDLTWEMLHDGDGDRKDAFGIFALPESFLVDPDGNLALIRRGTVDRAYLEENVTPLIEGRGAGG